MKKRFLLYPFILLLGFAFACSNEPGVSQKKQALVRGKNKKKANKTPIAILKQKKLYNFRKTRRKRRKQRKRRWLKRQNEILSSQVKRLRQDLKTKFTEFQKRYRRKRKTEKPSKLK